LYTVYKIPAFSLP